ncbi:methylmalonyl-CoA mutase family protein [Streptomyces sp. LP11]|uniref:Methylmalonyl-CoA mutase family protein n=1 Tax=Streptomyces pyxinicus TaxID=2970331 RepID=A0ABT2B3G9_9ACTN|nr:methylmalonyl-CoA mutase family protein [Streptomyces sp. LP11]MCS0603069.1 methylmalonyl-CoA mutase family protein [Streptomyces sp. LP11]
MAYAGRRPPTPLGDAGGGTAEESNARLRGLVAEGVTGLSLRFDRPTRLGQDSDAPAARGEIGRGGVAVDSLDDMRVLCAGVPLDEVAVSLTADTPAAPLLLLYQLVAEERGIRPGRLTGTLHRDLPRPSSRLTADLAGYRAAELPRWTADPLVTRPRPAEPSCPADPAAEARQLERLAKHRAWRDDERVDAHLTGLRAAAEGPANVLYPMKEALAAGATLGEVCAVLRPLTGGER